MIECVPNVSVGRDPVIVDAIRQAVVAAGGTVLDTNSDADHNRSVLTFTGDVFEGAFAAIRTASERIDISKHSGVHPRTGAADVVPFVPLGESTMPECIELAHRLGERVWTELKIPVYFYERAGGRRLEQIRRQIATLRPDVGDVPHPTAGVCIIGARKVLIAWNINLRSEDLCAAKEIAKTIRESGGGFPALKALGLALPLRGQVQVSMNLVDYEVTPLHSVFGRVRELCEDRGIEIVGSELIGMMPRAAIPRGYDLKWLNMTEKSFIC